MEKIRRNMKYRTYIQRFKKKEKGFIIYKNNVYCYDIDRFNKIMDRLYKNSNMERDR